MSSQIRYQPSVSWLLNLSEDLSPKPKQNETNQFESREQLRGSPALPALTQTISSRVQKSLALENINSLALLLRQSTERGIPIPRNMLSNSEDVFKLQAEQYQQNEPQLKVDEDVNDNLNDLRIEDAKLLVDSLGLEKLIPIKKDNTKNVLRNFGNAQNQFILYNKKAREMIEEQLHDPARFDTWVRGLKLENFEQFKKVWEEGSFRPYIRLYKLLCWHFYTEHAIPYVLSSRIKNMQTKSSHVKYIYRFLEGIRDPNSFNYFKKPEK